MAPSPPFFDPLTLVLSEVLQKVVRLIPASFAAGGSRHRCPKSPPDPRVVRIRVPRGETHVRQYTDDREVEETLTGRYLQTARTGRHALTVDEPKAVGGNDAGPGPYE